MSGCQFTTCFNPTHNYTGLAELAGLLAGFAFTTLGTVLTVSLASRQQYQEHLAHLRIFAGVLFCAFFGLALAAYDYIFVGAEEVTAGRALSEGLMADLTMMTATLLLFLAIVELIDFADLGNRIPFIREPVALLAVLFYTILLLNSKTCKIKA